MPRIQRTIQNYNALTPTFGKYSRHSQLEAVREHTNRSRVDTYSPPPVTINKKRQYGTRDHYKAYRKEQLKRIGPGGFHLPLVRGALAATTRGNPDPVRIADVQESVRSSLSRRPSVLTEDEVNLLNTRWPASV